MGPKVSGNIVALGTLSLSRAKQDGIDKGKKMKNFFSPIKAKHERELEKTNFSLDEFI